MSLVEIEQRVAKAYAYLLAGRPDKAEVMLRVALAHVLPEDLEELGRRRLPARYAFYKEGHDELIADEAGC